MFYCYNQNNSGGSFSYDKHKGIGYFVIIEADNADDANRRAEDIGLYFDGCDNGEDCQCCGDRWYMAEEDDGKDTPLIYGEDAFSKSTKRIESRKKHDCYGFVHYKSGEIKPVLQH
jgi:hypothetical protein